MACTCMAIIESTGLSMRFTPQTIPIRMLPSTRKLSINSHIYRRMAHWNQEAEKDPNPQPFCTAFLGKCSYPLTYKDYTDKVSPSRQSPRNSTCTASNSVRSAVLYNSYIHRLHSVDGNPARNQM